MALEQLRAVMNRKIRPKYVDAINAQTPYLPSLYQQKADTEYQNKLYDQNERNLAQQTEISNRNYGLAQDQLEANKDQAKKARKLGYANIGLGAATGLANLYQASKPLDIGTSELANVTTEVLPDSASLWDFGSGAASDAVSGFSSSPEYSEFSSGFSSGAGNNFFGGVGDVVSDYVVEPIKQFGSDIWDAGGSFLSGLGSLFD